MGMVQALACVFGFEIPGKLHKTIENLFMLMLDTKFFKVVKTR